ncbi:ergothioneine biosynthesis protein EgtC [Rhodococcus rhodnii]|uniref:Gamma-glutamyl-hercynylcysteine sulfoxide hydrolase n=2 Tax=Rhodococcus rhodnii TaxID=38312 RepID=R7WIG2_9NOCA|nr:ergothioneine biosynthesis protein EgtC [Rhodococcus rhodnii]EOM74980.1 hypothetical protein Rrhod_3700 [Rhodococcus rhodnii LMG 5362]TXG90256.1 ergothioneine biosynthesis protein EgtC [Rhodococcus rhodnii]
MCRHIGYVGPRVPVGGVLASGSHSLVHQSWAPTDMRGGGTINADGFGAAWWDGERQGRYRSAAPIWSDPAVQETLPFVHGHAVVAAARSASIGMPVEQSASHPFVDGRWAFSHNGFVPDWRRTLAPFTAELGTEELSALEAPTDSAALWLVVQHRLRSEPPEVVLPHLVAEVAARGPGARLNLLLSDGHDLWATSWVHSLSVRVDEHSATVASEPTDDDAQWKPVPDRHLVVARPGRLLVTPVEVRS